jgi:hypothetical protein
MYVIAARSTGQVVCSAERGGEWVYYTIGVFPRKKKKKKKQNKSDVINVINVILEQGM